METYTSTPQVLDDSLLKWSENRLINLGKLHDNSHDQVGFVVLTWAL